MTVDEDVDNEEDDDDGLAFDMESAWDGGDDDDEVDGVERQLSATIAFHFAPSHPHSHALSAQLTTLSLDAIIIIGCIDSGHMEFISVPLIPLSSKYQSGIPLYTWDFISPPKSPNNDKHERGVIIISVLERGMRRRRLWRVDIVAHPMLWLSLLAPVCPIHQDDMPIA